jgi:hypothetical protein
MQRRRSISSKSDHRGKKRYKEKKDAMHKRKKKEKPKQRGGK